MPHWKIDAFSNFLRFGPKVNIFQFSEKLLEFFVLIEDFKVEKLEKNDGENFFYLSLTVFWQFAIKVLKGDNSVYIEI